MKPSFKLVGKWEYGQGFMDLIHAFKDFNKDLKIYNQIAQIQAQVQKVLDSHDLADFLLLALKKQ
ncbi:MAG: hypothetical protein PUB96_03265 [Helicobacteraceae bacterium]|nr:hypothetical protein [Helicobacteraceae bacterium]